MSMSEDDTISSIPRLQQRASAGDPLALDLLIACASSPDRKTALDANKAIAAVAAGGDATLMKTLEGVRAKTGPHAAVDAAITTLRAKLGT